MEKDMLEGWGLDGKAGRKLGKQMMAYAEFERDFMGKVLRLAPDLSKGNPIQNQFEK